MSDWKTKQALIAGLVRFGIVAVAMLIAATFNIVGFQQAFFAVVSIALIIGVCEMWAYVRPASRVPRLVSSGCAGVVFVVAVLFSNQLAHVDVGVILSVVLVSLLGLSGWIIRSGNPEEF